jgi:hypothetical protein
MIAQADYDARPKLQKRWPNGGDDRRHRGRNFLTERLIERARELRERYRGDYATYMVELAKLFMANARDEKERKEAQTMLKSMKTFKRIGLWDE